MVFAFGVVGFFTVVVGLMGLFSLTTPKPFGFIALAIGGLSMAMAFARTNARTREPLIAGLALVLLMIVAVSAGVASWYALLLCAAAVLHVGVALEAFVYSRRLGHPMLPDDDAAIRAMARRRSRR